MHQPTPQQSQYLAWLLTRQARRGSIESLAGPLLDAQVDLNPHQVEAALFACKNPFERGVILADEVGLGKTIEAGLVILQHWAERKRRILIITPANLRKQWHQEIQEKFGLDSIILEKKNYIALRKAGEDPFDQERPIICSYQFAKTKAADIKRIPGNLSYSTKRTACATSIKKATSSPKPCKTRWPTSARKSCSLPPRCKTACLNSTASSASLMTASSAVSTASASSTAAKQKKARWNTCAVVCCRCANAPCAARCSRTSPTPRAAPSCKNSRRATKNANSRASLPTTCAVPAFWPCLPDSGNSSRWSCGNCWHPAAAPSPGHWQPWQSACRPCWIAATAKHSRKAFTEQEHFAN